jgi:uncharacterized membrane protein
MTEVVNTVPVRADKSAPVDPTEMGLHGLAQAYAKGQLNYQEYKRARTELLDRVTGDVTILAHRPERVEEAESHTEQSDASDKRREHIIQLLIGMVFVFVVTLTLLLWIVMH